MFDNLYGLSCIENHALAVLREYGTDIRPLYRDCAIPMKVLFDSLVYQGESREYFDRIIRVQDLAKELGIITMKLYRRGFHELITDINGENEYEYVFMRVTNEFTKTQLHARGLRDDHYVRVMPDNNDFKIISDIPEITLALTKDELATAYDGDYFKLCVNRDISDNDCEHIHENRVFKAENHEEFKLDIVDFNSIPEVGIRIRNMTGVYKVLRLRVVDYYRQYADTEFIKNRMPEVEKYFSLFEYFNIKKVTDIEKYFEVFCKINQLENEIMGELKQKLCKIKMGRKQDENQSK